MVMLKLSEDVSVRKVDVFGANVEFDILNTIAAAKFFQDIDFIKFLTDPHEQGGCNLTISAQYTVMTIGRKYTTGSFAKLVCMDLLKNLKTYIIPVSDNCLSENYNEWWEIATGLSYGQLTPSTIALNNLERGDKFLLKTLEEETSGLSYFRN